MTRNYPRAATRAAIGIGLGILLAQGSSMTAQRGAPAPKVGDAKPGEVRVMATTAIRGPIDEIKAEAEKAIGHPIFIEYGSARGALRDEILAGAVFDVAVVLPDVLDDAEKQGKIVPGSRADVAHVDVAVGQRGDAPKVDISTVEALKKAMLNAKSVKWAVTGAAMPGTNKIFEVTKVSEAIKDRANLPGQVPLGPGEYELQFNPLSEIMANKNLQNLGPVPKDVNVLVVMTAAIGTSAPDKKSAEALIKFLSSSAILPALKANGMMR